MFRDQRHAKGPLLILFIFALAVGIAILLPPKRAEPTPMELQVTFDHMLSFRAACDEYHRLTGGWPQTVPALTNIVRLKDPRILCDGWGRSIVLRSQTNVPGTIWLISYGADGLPGGVGSNADFTDIIR